MKVVLASNNMGKIEEFNAFFKPLAITLLPQAELGVNEMPETGLTFIENALIKARHAATVTGLPALADDSGLVVQALQGAPGIYSARYAGKQATANENIQKLLGALDQVTEAERRAYFHCVLVFMLHPHHPTPIVCEGDWPGLILREPKGKNGFGYDPVFYLPAQAQTAAELPLAIKNKISHRGIALQRLIKTLTEKLCLLSPSNT